jgi:transcriptional regulator with XRE-family HTH domain
MKLVEFLKTKVQEEGTLTAVSRKTGVSQGTISKILSGDTKPELPTIQKICKAYNVPLLDFVSEGAGNSTEHTAMYVTQAAKETPKVSERLVGYPKDIKTVADSLEIRVDGKTPEERRAIIDKIMRAIWADIENGRAH